MRVSRDSRKVINSDNNKFSLRHSTHMIWNIVRESLVLFIRREVNSETSYHCATSLLRHVIEIRIGGDGGER